MHFNNTPNGNTLIEVLIALCIFGMVILGAGFASFKGLYFTQVAYNNSVHLLQLEADG